MYLAPLVLVLVCLSFYPASCRVTSVEVSPSDPVQGDVLSVDVEADPGEEVDVQLRFRKDLQVSDGRYLLELYGVEAPQRPNSFTVKATGVDNLVLAVRLGIWISVSKEATNGVASISQGEVPSGRYDVQVKGDAAPGAGKVTIEVTARTTVTVESDGRYSISYDTSSIPAGTFSVVVGGVSRTVTLSEAGSVVPVPSIVPPLALFSLPSGLAAGDAGTFDASPSSDADGSIVEYVWEMGDGAVLRGKVISHTYGSPGLYAVALTVVDDVGLTGKRVELLNVAEPANRPPVPVVTTGRACFVGQSVGFSAWSSYDPDGRIASYVWDLGDGSQAEGASVNHVYGSAGLYNASLTVTDEGGLASVAPILVRVLSPPAGHTEWAESLLEDGGAAELPGQGGLIRVNSSAPVSILYFRYPGDPHPGDGLPPGQVGGFIDVSVGDPDQVRWPLYIEVRYDPGAVPAGDEDGLGLYHYGHGWVQCRNTGVRPGEAVVWARVQRDELGGSPLTIGARSLIEGAAVRGLTLSSHSVTQGEEVTVSAEVVNVGGVEAGFTVVLEVDGAAEALSTVRLGPGESRLVSWTLSFDAPGVHRVGAGGFTLELTVAEGTPDLTVSGSIPEEAEAGLPLDLSFSVSNGGDAASGGFKVGLYVGDAEIRGARVGSLAPGGSEEIVFTWTPVGPGVYPVRVVVDEDGEVGEADEANNVVSGSVEVTAVQASGGSTLVLYVGAAAVAAVLGLIYVWRRGLPR